MDSSSLLRFYTQLVAEIQRDEEALDEKKKVVAFLRRRITGDTVDDSSDDEGQPRPGTRRALVEGLVMSFNDQEVFTATSVFDKMKEQGIEDLPPKVRITTILGRMADAGRLVLVKRGGGNVPNEYRKAVAAEATGETANTPGGAPPEDDEL